MSDSHPLRRYLPLAAALLACAAVLAFVFGPSRSGAVPALHAEGAAPVPRRIVSLAPSLTEIAFVVGAGPQVVGVTDYCDYPPEAASRSRIGGFTTPSVERILALRPDLVLATHDGNAPDAVHALMSLGIAVYVANDSTLEEVSTTIAEVGARTGHAPEGEEEAARFRRAVREIERRVSGLPVPSVLFAYSSGNPLIAAGPGSFAHDLIVHAGGRNILADTATTYPHVSYELVLDRAPDVILTESWMSTTEGVDDSDVRAAWSRWDSLPAVKSGRVHLLDAAIVDRPSPRLVEGLKRIAELLHPEIGGK